MSSWPEVALGDVVSSLGGLWGEPEPADGHIEVLALRGTDFARARALDLSGVPRRFEKAKAVGKRLLDATSVVIEASGGSKDQPVGRSILIKQNLLDRADVPLSAASFCKILWVDEAIADARYIHGVLDNLYRSGEIERFQTQSTGLRNLRTRQLLSEFRFGLPPVDTQRRLAAVLSAFDELIEINERWIELLEDLARSLCREWFVHFRFPGHENVEFVDSELGPIPEGWEVGSIDDVAPGITRGIAPKYADQGSWTVINQRCIRNQRMTLAAARGHEGVVSDAKQLRFADVLINSTGVGTLGRVAMVLEASDRMTADSHVTITRAKSPEFHPWFGLHMLSRETDFQAMGTGSTGQTELGRAAIGELAVAIPPSSVLEHFAEVAWPLLRPIPTLAQRCDSLAETRDLLLPRLVTGRLEISDIDLGVLTPTEPE